MIRPVLTALLCLVLARPCAAGGCPVPDPFTIDPTMLVATRAAVAKGALTILALGGAATLGAAARDPAATYPARLEAHLRQHLPGIAVTVAVRADPARGVADRVDNLDADLAATHPNLVIWGPGGSAAAHGEDLDSFRAMLATAMAKVHTAGADMLLMTLQYAPSVAALIDLPPYRDAILRQGEDSGVTVLDRYELMRFWSTNGVLDLDAKGREGRIKVARQLFDCLAEILADGIADAVH